MIYIGIDGDNIGNKIELCFLTNNEDSIKILSELIDSTLNDMANALKAQGMQIIFCSGDSLLGKCNEFNINELKNILKKENKIHFSVGIGETISQTYLALKYAKFSGKNKIVLFENNEYRVL